MRHVLRSLALLVALAPLAAPVVAAPLADRLPAGASAIFSADMKALRASSLLQGAAWKQARGPALLESAGVRLGENVDHLAVAALAGTGKDAKDEFVALLTGRFDAADVRRSLAAAGARTVKVGDVIAHAIPDGASFVVHPALPSLQADSAVLVSFLGDAVCVATEGGTRKAHAPKEGIPSPALAAARKRVPASAPAWVALDGPGARRAAAGPAAAVGSMTESLQSLTAWVSLGNALDVRAEAAMATAQSAQQLAAMATLLSAAAQLRESGRALRGLKVAAEGQAVTASLSVSPESLAALQGGAAGATSAGPSAGQ